MKGKRKKRETRKENTFEGRKKRGRKAAKNRDNFVQPFQIGLAIEIRPRSHH